MTERRAFLRRQRDTRRAAQQLGAAVAAEVRRRRLQQLSPGVAAAQVAPSPTGDGLPQAVAGPPPGDDAA